MKVPNEDVFLVTQCAAQASDIRSRKGVVFSPIQ